MISSRCRSPSAAGIRLNLARTKEYPQGSARHGYEFTAPLDQTGHIDAATWKKERAHCRVRRFWGDEEEEIGHLIHRPGGSWAFHYDIDGDPDDDEVGFKFESHVFNEGEYVSISEHDGTLRTFRVVSVS